MNDPNTYLTQAAALHAIDPDAPPSAGTAKNWHDRLGGPRDGYGRRIWTDEVCAEIRKAREAARATRT